MKKLIPRSRKAVALAGAAFAAAIFGLGFLVTTYALPSQKPPLPTPNATQIAQFTQIIEYNQAHNITPEPPFKGELNGFTFQLNSPPICSSGTIGPSQASEHNSSLLSASGLDFESTDIPSGFQPVQLTDHFGQTGHVILTQCGIPPNPPKVVTVNEEWKSSTGTIDISRRATSPVIDVPFSKDRLQPTTINGRPAIIVNPRFSGEQVYIYMRDERGIWVITSKELGVAALLKVAEGIK